VPRVLELHARLKEEFAKGMDAQPDATQRDAGRAGKTLDPGRAVARSSGPGAGSGRPGSAPSSAAPGIRAGDDLTAR